MGWSAVGTLGWSVVGTMVGKPATWTGTCLLKLALPSLGLHWDYAAAYLDPQTPMSSLLSVDGC